MKSNAQKKVSPNLVLSHKIEDLASRKETPYLNAQPFPHAIIEELVEPWALDAVIKEFSALKAEWIYYHHVSERKQGFTKFSEMGPRMQEVISELQSPEFVAQLSRLTGIPDLMSDPDLDGGGLHETHPGGFLKIHADYMSHPKRKDWARRVNLLLFLNPDWKDEYAGSLELWDREMKACQHKILPLFNRCVIFNTDETSYHGVPDIVKCPQGTSRKSIALYYFTKSEGKTSTRPTYYRARPQDSLLHRMALLADRLALRVYAFIKRRFGISETAISKVLKWFNR